jgi:hypothetical protein
MKRMIALAALLPTVALAQDNSEISYDYFDFNYFRTDWDAGSTPEEIDGSGYAGRFSVGIRNHVFVGGEYRTWDPNEVEGRSTFKRIGIGAHWDVGTRWSVFGEVGFKSIDLDLGSGNMEDDPGYFGGGARWYMAEGYELRVGAEVSEERKGTLPGYGQVSVTIGGDIYLTNVATLSIEVNENDDNTTSFILGMRFYHKKDTDGFRQRR